MLLCFSITILTQACALWGSVEEPAYQAPLSVTSTADKTVYRPGEAVQVTVKLRNNTGQPIDLRALDATSVNVAYGRIDDAETPVFREPVKATRATRPQMFRLAPGATKEEKFLFTRLTYYEGPMKAIAQYDPNPPGTMLNGAKAMGNVMRFDVAGEPMFDRDHAGLITREQAIALAKAQVQGTVTDARAIMIEDETTGLFLTWVNLNVTPPGGGADALTAYLVEPYKGTVLSQAKPFNPAAVVDPHFQRPPSLPPKPVQTGLPVPGGIAVPSGAAPGGAAPGAAAPGAAVPAAGAAGQATGAPGAGPRR
jgi:hypothetical protein